MRLFSRTPSQKKRVGPSVQVQEALAQATCAKVASAVHDVDAVDAEKIIVETGAVGVHVERLRLDAGAAVGREEILKLVIQRRRQLVQLVCDGFVVIIVIDAGLKRRSLDRVVKRWL